MAGRARPQLVRERARPARWAGSLALRPLQGASQAAGSPDPGSVPHRTAAAGCPSLACGGTSKPDACTQCSLLRAVPCAGCYAEAGEPVPPHASELSGENRCPQPRPLVGVVPSTACGRAKVHWLQLPGTVHNTKTYGKIPALCRCNNNNKLPSAMQSTSRIQPLPKAD